MNTWSIVVVAKGMWPVTREFLQSLRATLPVSVELVYIDNGTPAGEDSWQAASCYLVDTPVTFCPAKMARFEGEGVNLSKAWNTAISMATAARILVCNNDLVFLKPGWLEQFEVALDDMSVGAAGMTGMSWRWVPFLQGSLFAFRKEVFEQVGGFDERFQFTCEDVDFCKRLQAAGYRIHPIDPPLLGEYVFHHEGATRNYYKQDIVKYQRLAHLSRLEYCYKYFDELGGQVHIHD